jgi:hypothetical protein
MRFSWKSIAEALRENRERNQVNAQNRSWFHHSENSVDDVWEKDYAERDL